MLYEGDPNMETDESRYQGIQIPTSGQSFKFANFNLQVQRQPREPRGIHLKTGI